MRINALIGVAAGTSLLVGCSSAPRAYAPQLAAAPADQGAFNRAYNECHSLLVAGKLDSEGRLASAGAAGAAGATTAAVGGATAAAIAGYGGLAAASATIVLLPFAIVGGAVGMAKAKRNKKERAIKAAMTGCLAERGYPVRDWVRLNKKEAAAAAAARQKL